MEAVLYVATLQGGEEGGRCLPGPVWAVTGAQSQGLLGVPLRSRSASAAP